MNYLPKIKHTFYTLCVICCFIGLIITSCEQKLFVEQDIELQENQYAKTDTDNSEFIESCDGCPPPCPYGYKFKECRGCGDANGCEYYHVYYSNTPNPNEGTIMEICPITPRQPCTPTCDVNAPKQLPNIIRDGQISKFLNEETSNFLQKIVGIYIKYNSELTSIFQQKEPQYANAQQAFKEFWTVYEPLTNQVFANNETVVLDKYHIELATNLLNELSKVVQNTELKNTIEAINENVHIMQGKELKQALKTFDTMDLKIAK